MIREFTIEGRKLGAEAPTYFIADIAANHDGDLSRALRLIDLAAAAGADAAKFQNFHADRIVSKVGFERVGNTAHQATWKKSVVDVYKDAEISEDWTQSLRDHCTKAGIAYFTSAYDAESVDLVDRHVEAYKIGSGDITFTPLLRYVASKGKALFLATGASTLQDVIEAVETIHASAPAGTPLCVMQCNTNYTGSLENFRYVALNVLKTYALLFPDALLGLSDHTPGHATTLGAVALGARVIEKHFTDDTNRSGPDHAFSLTPAAWRDMVDRTRELEYALGSSEKRIESNESSSAVVQRRSLYAKRAIAAGSRIGPDDIEALRPCPEEGIPPTRADLLIGAIAPRGYSAGDAFALGDWLRAGR